MPNKKFQLIILAALLVFAIVTVAVVVVNNNQSNETVHDDQPSIEGQPTIGEADAPVQIVEFGDFKCPSCKAWEEVIFPQLENDYLDNGDVSYSFINVLFHGEESKIGSLAAESVLEHDPESYWTFHKKMFEEQPAQNHDSLWITHDKMAEIAEETTSMNVSQLMSDLEQETMAEQVNQDMDLVEEFDVQFTPSIMVNGTMMEDPFDYEALKALIDQELEG
ncbi:DsbA family protein [Jeotgalibacillus proteolyticus]|uniref:Dihydroneopterin aldolase n=1 Tax=Jeotgalibacillus proteolyticus TaxID=2082395 RepID=A0A2S5G839_9BACL|nr:DsbA family protein [Jeotgalibacillus proteolyticus]PPA69094.1 dihydroneopterin aldolase [Jeotgalibacillus proteolyticus]